MYKNRRTYVAIMQLLYNNVESQFCTVHVDIEKTTLKTLEAQAKKLADVKRENVSVCPFPNHMAIDFEDVGPMKTTKDVTQMAEKYGKKEDNGHLALHVLVYGRPKEKQKLSAAAASYSVAHSGLNNPTITTKKEQSPKLQRKRKLCSRDGPICFTEISGGEETEENQEKEETPSKRHKKNAPMIDAVEIMNKDI
jgi:hypothetical protein